MHYVFQCQRYQGSLRGLLRPFVSSNLIMASMGVCVLLPLPFNHNHSLPGMEVWRGKFLSVLWNKTWEACKNDSLLRNNDKKPRTSEHVMWNIEIKDELFSYIKTGHILYQENTFPTKHTNVRDALHKRELNGIRGDAIANSIRDGILAFTLEYLEWVIKKAGWCCEELRRHRKKTEMYKTFV